jgi:hypothetical protein
MNYDKVQQYAGAYHVQEHFIQLQEESLNQFLKLQSYVIAGFDPKTMTTARAEAAGVDVRQTMGWESD